MVISTERKTPVVPALAGLWSLLTVALGLWWLVQPSAYPFEYVPGQFGAVLDVLEPATAGLICVGAGLLGLATLVLVPLRVLTVGVAAVFAIWFGLVVPGVAPLTMVGYMMAMFGPVVLFAVVLAGAWRWRGGPALVGAFVLVGVVAWVTGLADATVLARYAGVITGSLQKFVSPAVLTFFLLGGLLWGVLGAKAILAGRPGRAAPAWTRPESAARWGKVAAVVAAVCALPYGVHRITWLTPWPIGMDPADLAANPEMRLHGLLLGLSALAGALLTMGLVSRWGEVWPRWVPGVRGRPVPPAAAVVPGGLVAALFTVAAIPLTAQMFTDGGFWGVLVFPFPIWGPALAIAVLGYALRRRGSAKPVNIQS
ncbi:hypothetical protein [Pseudonocardia sp. TRM90224]|uniref:hypothetical protein n=1 Tax=Pseudonocardia sp. TRM90224 TaxID=2812678 RepID=UPI001E310520|nr:hypothetical protein [Pseudonocardia sp. TRM90224]